MFLLLFFPFLQILPIGFNERLLNYEIAGVFIAFLIGLFTLFYRSSKKQQEKIYEIMEKRIHENNVARDKYRESYETSLAEMGSTIIEQQKEISNLQRQSDTMGFELKQCHLRLSEKIDEITRLNTELTKQMAEVTKLLTSIDRK